MCAVSIWNCLYGLVSLWILWFWLRGDMCRGGGPKCSSHADPFSWLGELPRPCQKITIDIHGSHHAQENKSSGKGIEKFSRCKLPNLLLAAGGRCRMLQKGKPTANQSVPIWGFCEARERQDVHGYWGQSDPAFEDAFDTANSRRRLQIDSFDWIFRYLSIHSIHSFWKQLAKLADVPNILSR